jgi:hypothetical protein
MNSWFTHWLVLSLRRGTRSLLVLGASPPMFPQSLVRPSYLSGFVLFWELSLSMVWMTLMHSLRISFRRMQLLQSLRLGRLLPFHLRYDPYFNTSQSLGTPSQSTIYRLVLWWQGTLKTPAITPPTSNCTPQPSLTPHKHQMLTSVQKPTGIVGHVRAARNCQRLHLWGLI